MKTDEHGRERHATQEGNSRRRKKGKAEENEAAKA